MSTPILKTKLHVPVIHQNIISRPRLIKRLDSGVKSKFTLVSAPAGFGKSTLVSSWAQQHNLHPRIAWLSLDDDDNDLTRFLTYFVAALQTIENNLGQGALVALQSPGAVNIEVVLISMMYLYIADK